jgi:hypothetical protein
MTEALRWKSKLIRAKRETSYGVDPTPTQAILAKNVVCKPMEGEDVSRDLERPFRGAQQMYPVGLRVLLEFDVELVGGGATGVAPPISPLLRSLGLAEVLTADVVGPPAVPGKVEYTPISTAYESAGIYFWIGGNRQKILGIRGTATFNITAQQIPVIHFVLTGLYDEPALTALGAIDMSAFQVPLVAGNVNTPTLTIDGVSFVTRSVAFNLANDVQHRLLIGRSEITIVDSAEEIDVVVEALPLATFNPFAKASSLASAAFVVQQDTRAGYKVKVEAATCSVRRLADYQDDQGVLMWPLKIAPLPTDAGNDQFKITIF